MRISDWSSDVCSSDLVQRILEIRPFGRRAGGVGGKGPSLPLPSRIGALGGGDLLRAHAGEEIIALVEFAHMVQAQPAPIRPLPVRSASFQRRRAKFSRLLAARNRAGAGAFPAAGAKGENTGSDGKKR